MVTGIPTSVIVSFSTVSWVALSAVVVPDSHEEVYVWFSANFAGRMDGKFLVNISPFSVPYRYMNPLEKRTSETPPDGVDNWV
jgi:hypothetical protein